jgi:hypothetical protein
MRLIDLRPSEGRVAVVRLLPLDLGQQQVLPAVRGELLILSEDHGVEQTFAPGSASAKVPAP